MTANNFVDKIGNRYGMWTVISQAESLVYGDKNLTRWLCHCDCGVEKIVRGGLLRQRGGSRSCGCQRNAAAKKNMVILLSHQLPDPDAPILKLFSGYKSAAKQRNYDFLLDFVEFKSLVTSNCSYCGEHPSHVQKTYRKHGLEFLYNGIDRVDNSKPYVSGNCVPCCTHCNLAKRTMSLEIFREWIRKVYKHMESGLWPSPQ